MESRILEACREELARQIAPRAQILDVGSSGPHRCDLLLERGGVQGGRSRLVVELSPSHPCFYLTRAVTPMSVNEQLRRSLVGRWITDVDRPTPGPLLRLLLSPQESRETESWLVFEWLGGSPGAVVVAAASQEVLASLGEPKGPGRVRRERGASYRWPSPPHKPAYERATEEQIRSSLEASKDPDRARALARGLSGLPVFLAIEAIHRGGSSPSAVAAALRAIATEPPSPTLYAIPDPPPGLPREFVSPIRLSALMAFEEKRSGGLFRLLEQAHETVLRHEEEQRTREGWLRILALEASRLTRLHDRLGAEIKEASGAPDMRQKAEAILIHLREIPRGANHFSCPDPKEPRVTLRIDLDPRLPAAANAEALFRRVRRLERGVSLRAKRIRALEETIARLAALREQTASRPRLLPAMGAEWLRHALGPFRRESVLAAWEKEMDVRMGTSATRRAEGPIERPGGRATDKNVEESTRRSSPLQRTAPGARQGEGPFRPRSFKTREGWTVLVGRSNKENDYVTHRLAKPDDYWFHVHGCPGSHVVLRREGRKDNPSARTIEEVASIAAFFSKARTSRKAPVIYTLKKYVRKARGGSPGLAIVTRERTIMVVPEAPVDAGPPGWGDEDL